ncbi:MAG: hypothetical protein ACOH1T_06910 [Microbacteriaceae bacterium]
MTVLDYVTLIAAATDGDDDSGVTIGFFVATAIITSLIAVAFSRYFANRQAASAAAATEGTVDSFAVVLAPAQPFDAAVHQIRDLVGEPTPPSRITRYTVPLVTKTHGGLTLSDKKIGRCWPWLSACLIAAGPQCSLPPVSQTRPSRT